MMRHCRRARFTLPALCLPVFASGCTYTDVRWDPWESVDYSPREVRAERTFKTEDSLLAEGYAGIGTIAVEKATDSTSVAEMRSWLCEEAARHGGDLIEVKLDCELIEHLSESFYTPRSSTSWTSGGYRTTTTYTGPTQTTIHSETIYRSTGVVWRYDPALAQKRIAAKKKAAAQQRLLAELWRAVEACDIERARTIVSTGKLPVNFPQPAAERQDGQPATSLFSESLRHGCTEVFLDLVKARWPDGSRDPDRAIAFPFASEHDRWSVFRYIVEQDNVEALSALMDAGLTPAHFPAKFNFFHTALVRESDRVLRRLLSVGSTAESGDWVGRVPLYPEWRKMGDLHGTPLHVAAELDRATFVAPLVRYGVPLETKARGGNPEIVDLTALQIAAMRGRPATVAALLTTGANAKAKTKTGKTALDLARERGHEKAVRLLASGTTPAVATTLAEAARDGDLATLRKLLEAGDVDGRDDRGRTAIMSAAAAGDDLMIAALLAAEPDLSIRDQAGETAADAAQDREIKRMLVNRGCEMSVGEAEFLRAVEEDDLDLLQLFIEAGANVNARGPDGNTALHIMARRGETEMVRLLLSHGADPNHPNASGSPPLGLTFRRETRKLLLDAGARIPATADALVRAAFQGEVDSVKQILAAGVDVDSRNSSGDTALTMAVKMLKKEVLVFLLERGADPNATDGKGRSPLDYAFLPSYRELLVAAGGRHTEAGRREYEKKLRR